MIVEPKNIIMTNQEFTSTIDQDVFWKALEYEESRRKPRKYNSKKSLAELDDEYLNALMSYEKTLENTKIVAPGQIVKGIIEEINRKEIIINFNYKDFIYVENKVGDFKIIENLKKGDIIDVLITSINDNPYKIEGSIADIIRLSVANKLKNIYANDVPLLAEVKEMIPAGFMLDIEMDKIILNTFMPNTLADVNRLTQRQNYQLIGKKIYVCLESLQKEKGVYVVSRRKYLKKLIPEKIKELKKETPYRGIVTGTAHYGVYIQFNECLTGMIHKSMLDEKWRDKIQEIPAGTEIEFYVSDISKDNRIILTQYLKPSLWNSLKQNFIYVGKVKKIINGFGVLVFLDNDTVGLVQNAFLDSISDDERSFSANSKTYKMGDTVKVQILSVFKENRKAYLKILE